MADPVRAAYWQSYKYYEGHLHIKVSKSNYIKRWVVLLGNELHLYTQKIPQREQGVVKPIQHYPLHESVRITLEDDFKMYIKCELWTIRAQVSTNEERENWRIRILTIAKGEPPKQGKLLPGQQEVLLDILQKEGFRKHTGGKSHTSAMARRSSSPGEMHSRGAPPLPSSGKRRVSTTSAPPYTENSYYQFLPNAISFSQTLPPVWFCGKISRAKAEQILHQSQSNGDLLLRESEAHPSQFTLSVRQETENKSLIRHYMFKKDPYGHGFVLLIEDKPPVLASMYELMWFFIQESGGHLLPLQKDPHLPDPNYEGRLHVHPVNPDNGEMLSRHHLSKKSYSFDEKEITSISPPEDDYLVPNANAPNPTAPPPRGRSSSSSRPSLRSVGESIDETDDTYCPSSHDDEMPVREAPPPPPGVLPPVPSPTSPNSSSGYIKMRSYAKSTPPSAAASPKDAGYINMRRGPGGGSGDDDDKEEDAPLRPSLSLPPEPTTQANVGELHKVFKRFGLREESSA